jgi:hypothetical protein
VAARPEPIFTAANAWAGPCTSSRSVPPTMIHTRAGDVRDHTWPAPRARRGAWSLVVPRRPSSSLVIPRHPSPSLAVPLRPLVVPRCPSLSLVVPRPLVPRRPAPSSTPRRRWRSRLSSSLDRNETSLSRRIHARASAVSRVESRAIVSCPASRANPSRVTAPHAFCAAPRAGRLAPLPHHVDAADLAGRPLRAVRCTPRPGLLARPISSSVA